MWWREAARGTKRQLICTSTAWRGTAEKENDSANQEGLCGDGALHYSVYCTAAEQVGKSRVVVLQ